MFEMIQAFPTQLEQAIQIGLNALISGHSKRIQRIYVSGMGGSGIGADFVASFIKSYAEVPYIVGKTYDVPAFVDDETLVIISSSVSYTHLTLPTNREV